MAGMTIGLFLFSGSMVLAQSSATDRGKPKTDGAPPIVFSPQINVPPAPAPTINVQSAKPEVTVQAAPPVITGQPASPPADPTKWLAVVIAMASAVVGVGSAILAYSNQKSGFRKDAAAIARDIKSKSGNALIQAFENNVARPIGMTLDQIERVTMDMAKLSRVAAAKLAAEQIKYAALLRTEQLNILRLCREADGALAATRLKRFAPTYQAASIDAVLYRAGSEALSGGGQDAIQESAFQGAMTGIADVKVKLRDLLEEERRAQIAEVVGDIRSDPYYRELQRWLGADFTTRQA